MTDTWAVTLEQFHVGRWKVVFDSIETGFSLTMSREMFNHAGSPATLTILVPEDEISDPGKLSHDSEQVS